MIIFSEGVPRSGKSYGAVKNHILPALKAGRRVVARLNGLNHQRIADYCGIDLEECVQRLELVDNAQVRSLFVAYIPEGGESWTISERFRGALIVIDEVHEFYVGGGKEQLPGDVEQFFALHGQYEIDMLLMTQFYKRLHLAIRSRIERKNTFQKLSVLGGAGKLGIKGKKQDLYRVTYWQSLAPDRYEKVGGETKRYDADIFPLYKGYAHEGAEAKVYDSGSISVWKPMLWRAAIVIPLALYSIYYLINFFAFGGAMKLVNLPEETPVAQVTVGDVDAPPPGYGAQAQQPVVLPASTVSAMSPPPPAGIPQHAANQSPAAIPVVDPYKGMTAEQRYIWKMSDDARIRFAGALYGASAVRGVLEWYGQDGQIMERMETAQVQALGVDVRIMIYGVRLRVGEKVIVATAWPVTAPVREVEARLYDTSGQAGSVQSGGAPSSVSPLSAAGTYAAMHSYGDIETAPAGTNSVAR